MADISQNDIFKWISLNKIMSFLLKISLKLICFQVSNKKYSNIGSYNGLAPTRRQAIIWTNDGPV